MATETFSEDELAKLEREHPQGVSSEEILAYFARKGAKFSEATLRKYVQLGLLPRSRRVGLKGKHRGSQGMYPATVVRRIQRIKTMLHDHTIEQIQTEFLFVRGDMEELERTLERIFASLAGAAKSGRAVDGSRMVAKELGEARQLAAELVAKVTSIESRLTMQARLQREAV
jgi:DNA-binding transcriptional MerR regulator